MCITTLREVKERIFLCQAKKKPKKEEDLIMGICPCKTMVPTRDIGVQLHRLMGVDTESREPNL